MQLLVCFVSVGGGGGLASERARARKYMLSFEHMYKILDERFEKW